MHYGEAWGERICDGAWGKAAARLGEKLRRAVDRGFVLSDHADWPGLMGAIAATGASRVIVTHGSVPVMVRYLTEQGLQAESFDTEYGGDGVEADVQAPDASGEAAA